MLSKREFFILKVISFFASPFIVLSNYKNFSLFLSFIPLIIYPDLDCVRFY